MPDTLPRLAEAIHDRYRVERELGQGGMATVYLAHDLRHNRRVALKVLATELAALIGPERFLKEIEVTANLQHPHILPLFDSGVAQAPDGPRFLYYVMPYVEGDTLRDRLRREKQLGVEESVELVRSVASALDYAHRHGVIHRDIKPENVLLHDGQALLADFGIALAVREAGGTRLTGTGLSVGTPSYMSPEQAMGDRELDARSDIYSLGAMLYEMLAGDPPFTGHSAQAIVARILTETAVPLTRHRASVPAHVAAAIQKSLERLPADRFATAGAFAAALGDPGFTLPAMAAASGAPARRALWNPLSIGACAVATVAVAGLAWLGTRPEPTAPTQRYSLTLAPGQELTPNTFDRLSFAPDGSGFVYVGGASGRLHYRPLGQLAATPLPGTEGASSSSFSPDGSRVAFIASPFAVKIVPLNGAPAVTVVGQGVLGGGVAWSADDWIYFDTGASLDRIRPDGAGREVAVAIDTMVAEVGFAWPEPLPNGTGLVYRSRGVGQGIEGYVLKAKDLRSGAAKTLVQGLRARYLPSGHLAYVTADGTLLVAPFDQDRLELAGPATPIAQGLSRLGFGSVDLAASRAGDLLYLTSSASAGHLLSWVTRDGRFQVVDAGWPLATEAVQGWALSPDGRRLAIAIGAPGGTPSPSDIWVKELDTGPLSRLTFEGINVAPAWTPDGQSVIYISIAPDDPTVSGRIARIRADGTGTPELLLAETTSASLLAVSPRDGRVVVGTSDQASADLLSFMPGVDTALTPLVASPALEATPAISPDGRWLAYTALEGSSPQVFVRPFPDVQRGKWQVSLDGGYFPKWGPDGKELFYDDPTGGFVMAQVSTSPTFSVGRRQLLHPTGSPVPFFDVAPDGRRTLRFWTPSTADSARTELVLVRNLTSELRTGGARR